MSKILPILFVMILGSVGVGMDYYLYLQKGKVLGALGEDQSGSYFNYVAQRLQASAAEAAVSDLDLTTPLPSAPEGWERRPFEIADGEALSGRAFIKTNLVLDTTNDMVGMMGSLRISGSHIADTYISGDKRIIVEVSFRPAADSSGFLGKLASEMMSTIEGQAEFDENNFGFVKGVNFIQGKQVSKDFQTGIETPVPYRTFHARLGQQASFLIASNASDAEIAAIIGKIDVVGLNKWLKNPVPFVHDDKPILFGDDLKALDDAAKSALAEPAAVPVEAVEEPAAEAVAKSETKVEKGAKPKIISKGCVRRAGVLDCPKS